MRNNYKPYNEKPVFVTTCKYLIPKKYFNDEKYFIEIVVFDEEYDPALAGMEEYIVYLK